MKAWKIAGSILLCVLGAFGIYLVGVIILPLFKMAELAGGATVKEVFTTLLLILGVGCLLMLAFYKLPVLRALAGSLMSGAFVTALLSFLSYPIFGNHLSGGDLAGIIITMSVASLISVGCSKLGMKKTLAGIWALALLIAFLIVIF